MTSIAVPRRSWTMWLQGMDEAPPVVQRCLRSWRDKNPRWELVVMTRESLDQWLSSELLAKLRSSALSDQQLSDLVRLDVLGRYGGVWADASTWCVRPLDGWIDEAVLGAGLFAFSWCEIPEGVWGRLRPSEDGVISSWFLAAAPNNKVVDGLRDDLEHYWLDHEFRNGQRRFLSSTVTSPSGARPRWKCDQRRGDEHCVIGWGKYSPVLVGPRV
jgi:Capsular polysaccharide synthesis protein